MLASKRTVCSKSPLKLPRIDLFTVLSTNPISWRICKDTSSSVILSALSTVVFGTVGISVGGVGMLLAVSVGGVGMLLAISAGGGVGMLLASFTTVEISDGDEVGVLVVT